MASEHLVSQICSKIKEIEELYHRLLLLVGPAHCGKTELLQNLHQETSAPLININLELSRRMLEIPEAKRAYFLPQVLKDILPRESGLILLDNIEILFDNSLRQDPLKLLQNQSRKHSIIAAWNGSIDGESLTYAAAGHPEYRRYPAQDLAYLNLSSSRSLH